MAELFLMMFGPFVAGLVLAIAWWLLWGRTDGQLVDALTGFTLAAASVALFGDLLVRLLNVSMWVPIDLPLGFWVWYSDYRFMIPLVFGVVGSVMLTFPIRSRRGQGTAELARRSPASFIRLRWLTTPVIALTLIILITVLTGVASQPDSEMGQYTTYWVEPGGELGFGTGIYGWFYSVPALILVGVLVALTTVNLFLIARPAVAENREQDIRERTIRTRNILSAVSGTLLLHLGIIFHSLSLTSSLRGSFPTLAGSVTITTPFSAFGPAFEGAFILCCTLGIAFWATVALSAMPSHRRARVVAQS